jgi:hypothetical protein
MRHATCGLGFRTRAIATVALLTVGMMAALRGVFEALF